MMCPCLFSAPLRLFSWADRPFLRPDPLAVVVVPTDTNVFIDSRADIFLA